MQRYNKQNHLKCSRCLNTIHPNHAICLDQIQNTTNKREDDHIGGKKYIGTKKRGKTKYFCDFSETMLTHLDSTSAKVEPLICTVIFAGDIVTVDEFIGIIICVPP